MLSDERDARLNTTKSKFLNEDLELVEEKQQQQYQFQAKLTLHHQAKLKSNHQAKSNSQVL